MKVELTEGLDRELELYSCGERGCAAKTKRRGTERYCSQKAIVWRDGIGYCYYHDPRAPKVFGEPREARDS